MNNWNKIVALIFFTTLWTVILAVNKRAREEEGEAGGSRRQMTRGANGQFTSPPPPPPSSTTVDIAKILDVDKLGKVGNEQLRSLQKGSIWNTLSHQQTAKLEYLLKAGNTPMATTGLKTYEGTAIAMINLQLVNLGLSIPKKVLQNHFGYTSEQSRRIVGKGQKAITPAGLAAYFNSDRQPS
ncbi:hypothetical protein LSTR_LSTR010900 [Laodelphax striatellus]|uniref:Uncharacterized protein n=1 Tax=Laodelphax striatellus TaxID=195883 RepID=A0A482WJR7_LAOST|nr:hypothetical protein LSTR_LSTR010900 [Laodelphax striatellus]